jgi:hypothetical protein
MDSAVPSYTILSEKNIASAVAEIADPATATTEEIANKLNELIGALKASGLMES